MSNTKGSIKQFLRDGGCIPLVTAMLQWRGPCGRVLLPELRRLYNLSVGYEAFTGVRHEMTQSDDYGPGYKIVILTATRKLVMCEDNHCLSIQVTNRLPKEPCQCTQCHMTANEPDPTGIDPEGIPGWKSSVAPPPPATFTALLAEALAALWPDLVSRARWHNYLWGTPVKRLFDACSRTPHCPSTMTFDLADLLCPHKSWRPPGATPPPYAPHAARCELGGGI